MYQRASDASVSEFYKRKIQNILYCFCYISTLQSDTDILVSMSSPVSLCSVYFNLTQIGSLTLENRSNLDSRDLILDLMTMRIGLL